LTVKPKAKKPSAAQLLARKKGAERFRAMRAAAAKPAAKASRVHALDAVRRATRMVTPKVKPVHRAAVRFARSVMDEWFN